MMMTGSLIKITASDAHIWEKDLASLREDASALKEELRSKTDQSGDHQGERIEDLVVVLNDGKYVANLLESNDVDDLIFALDRKLQMYGLKIAALKLGEEMHEALMGEEAKVFDPAYFRATDEELARTIPIPQDLVELSEAEKARIKALFAPLKKMVVHAESEALSGEGVGEPAPALAAPTEAPSAGLFSRALNWFKTKVF